jgi:hypothetical protein
MLDYSRVAQLTRGMTEADSETTFTTRVIPNLLDLWLADYCRTVAGSDVVQTTSGGFSYLFDMAAERLISAWGISRGRSAAPRDRYRMARHPLGAGDRYHRGHAIAHRLGGPTDINLVPQLGSINVGAFQVLERRARAMPGSLYFTYWKYRSPTDQTPSEAEQGLLIPGREAEIRPHRN